MSIITKDGCVPEYVKRHLYSLISLVSNKCPICGEIQDKRYKRLCTTGMHIVRVSFTSFTIRCKQCHLKMNISWASLVKAIRYQANNINKEEDKRIWLRHVQLIEKAMNTETQKDKMSYVGSFRKAISNPVK